MRELLQRSWEWGNPSRPFPYQVRLRLPFRKARTLSNLLAVVRLRTCLGLVEGWPCRSGGVYCPVSAGVLALSG